MKYLNKKTIFSFLIIALFIFPIFTNADEIDDLEKKITEQRNKITELDKEIEKQRQKVTQTAAEANTIAGKVAELQASKNKIEKGISQTEAEIERSSLTIQKLGIEIDDKETKINKNNNALAIALRELDMLENTSLIETILGYDDMSEFWNQLRELESFQDEVQDTVVELKDLNTELKGKQTETTEEKKQLETSKKVLSGEREVVAATKQEQDKLLAIKRNTEQTYRDILAEKLRQKQEFDAALTEFESQLQILVDPGTFPGAKNGILNWPLNTIRVTQQFGGTQFAKNNPGIYGRGYHPGTDFGVPVGEKVKTVLSGIVQDTGNTDAFPGCYSWGKWILVKHNNGLSTLYAHLSSILVSPGQQVATGDVIGLSGSTGVSTGPHLHLTLYASQGVEVHKFSDFRAGTTGCSATGATTPVAAEEAYLDPMSYLPAL